MKKEEIHRDKYLYDPFDKVKINLLRQYDEFKDIKDDKIIIYIILAYDYNSDLRREYHIRAQQKVEAAIMAGFKFTNNEFDKSVEEILIGEKYDVDLAIVRYLSFFGKPELVALEYDYQKMDDLLYDLRKGSGDKSKKKGGEAADMAFLVAEINKYTEIVFGGVETITARAALYDFAKKQEKLLPRPEVMADKLEEIPDAMEFQEELGVKPYGDYNATKDKNYLHFKGDR